MRNIAISPPFISIVVSVYNAESITDYFHVCMRSICAQSHQNIEIVVVDDGSTDNTPELIASYSKADKRIQVVRHECNRGLGAARNTGMQASLGEYVWHVDADDYLPLNACAILAKVATSHKPDIVAFDHMKCRNDDRFESLISDTQSRLDRSMKRPQLHLLTNNRQIMACFLRGKLMCSSWSMLISRRIGSQVICPPHHDGRYVIEDVPYALNLYALAKFVIVLPCALYLYRAFGTHSLSHNYLRHGTRAPHENNKTFAGKTLCEMVGELGARYHLSARHPRLYFEYYLKWQLRYVLVTLEHNLINDIAISSVPYMRRDAFSRIFIYLCRKWWTQPIKLIDGIILIWLFIHSPKRARLYYIRRHFEARGVRRL